MGQVTAGPDAHPGVRWIWADAQRPAGLLTCGSWLGWPSRAWAQWLFQLRSPLTVAGAVTVLAPYGYTSPYSLLLPWRLCTHGTDRVPLMSEQAHQSQAYKAFTDLIGKYAVKSVLVIVFY